MFICLCNELLFMFCLMNFSLDILNLQPFPGLFLFVCFFAQITSQQNFENLVAWSHKSSSAFFSSGIHGKKNLKFACLLMYFCFLCCTENKEKWPGNSRGLSGHPSGEPQLPDKTRNTRRRNNAVIAFELVSCKMTQQQLKVDGKFSTHHDTRSDKLLFFYWIVHLENLRDSCYG